MTSVIGPLRTAMLRHSTTVARRNRIGATSYFSTESSGQRIALVLGSSGALGSTVSRYLSREHGMVVLGADVVEMPSDFNRSDWELDGFISLPTQAETLSAADVTMQLASGVDDILGETEEIATIVVASGGWAGDPQPVTGKGSLSEEIRLDAMDYGNRIQEMIHMNLFPVIAASYTAQRFMGPNGLFVTIGATAALSSTPGMMGYGLSKAASHHLVGTMGATTGKSLESTKKQKAGRRHRQYAANLDTMSVVAILPTTIDTPSNRQGNPDADFDDWTPSIDIAVEIGKWVEMPVIRPHSGALVKVTSSANGSVFDIAR